MFKQIFLFELKLWFKKPVTYIFFVVFFGLSMLLTAAIGGLLGESSDDNTIINSASSIASILSSLNTDLIGIIILITIIAPAVYKDFQYNMHPLLFTKPISKFGYIFGRFSAAFVIALFVISGTVFGHMITCMFPGIESERLGSFVLLNYIQPFIYFIVPNTLLIGAIFFSLVTFTRNMLSAYIGTIILLVLKGISPQLLSDMSNETLAAMLDPFGDQAMSTVAKYWSSEEKNVLPIPFDGIVLYNRLLWLGVAMAITLLSFYRFKFSQFNDPIVFFKWRKNKEIKSISSAPILSISDIPKANQLFSFRFSLYQTWFLAKFEFSKIVKSIFFIIIVLLCILTLLIAPAVFGQLYGTPTYIVTYQILDIANAVFMIFAPILIIFYSGILVWKERDVKIDELVGVAPVVSWVSFVSKLVALVLMMALLLFALMLTGIFIQLYNEFYDIDVFLYVKELYGFKLIGLSLLCVLSIAIQVIFNQKFVGYFISALIILILPFVARFLDWDNELLQFNNNGPQLPYSDMNGFGNNLYSFIVHKTYWIGFAILLGVVSNLLWVRGKEKGFKIRFRLAKPLFDTNTKLLFALGLVIFLGMGSFIYYNNSVLNNNYSRKELKKLQADFEKNYKKYKQTQQPRIVSANWNVDIFPEKRGAKVNGYYILKNKSKKNIDSIIVNVNSEINNLLTFSKPTKLVLEDKKSGFFIYQLPNPLLPGDSIQLSMVLDFFPKGFENTSVHFNGTFFNSSTLPSIGYNSQMELSDNEDREEQGLGKKERMAGVNDSIARMNTYISNDADWIDFECVVSTTKDQIAMAPGYLQKEWEKDGRKYFHYKMDCKILNFYSFLSAKYEVKKDKWNEVAIEVYYQKGHEYNLDRMIKAVKKSLDYYTKNFSPYQHKQVRILEFPRYQMFAQSFPNTIPFSEGIGFIAKVDEKDEESIDFPFYVTAHEVAHQWWAHQVIGGNVQGSTLMSETMSQYSALMVMEKEYGKQAMKKFLKYEMDKYLQGRSFERKKEQPLMYVENQQYIHYNKGSIIMYALKDYIGEDSLNAALAKYVKQVAYQEPPYTNSIEFVDYLKAATPDSLKYIINDMFETITLYENKISTCSYTKTKEGKCLVKFSIASKKMKADSIGKLKDAPIADWIDIVVFGEKEEKGKKTDIELYAQKRKIDKNKMDFEILVDALPTKVGIDPYNKLVDRTPANNTKSFTGGGKKGNDAQESEGGVTVTIGG